MALLRVILLVSVFTVSCQELPVTVKVSDTPSIQPCSQTVITSNAILDLKIQISQQNTKIQQQNTKFEQQNTKFAVQNTKLAEQDITILQQNIKIRNMEMKIEELEEKGIRDNQPPPSNNLETGSIFTRWGRRDCPRNVSQLVYSAIAGYFSVCNYHPGITGGSRYDHSGGAAEYVCLPPDPSWNRNKLYNNSYWGYVYGGEYEEIPKPIQNYKVPCAVCRTSQLSTVVMIPARSECYPGWQEAYHGELVSGDIRDSAASQYVCLDDEPQTNGTDSSYGGKLMYPVRARCESLPCPPYEHNTLLTCVVCLK